MRFLDRQIWPWSTKWSRATANRVLPRECTGHSKHPLPTTQGMTLHMVITGWSIPKSDWLYWLQPKMENIYTVSKNKPGADCGSDHQLLIKKYRLKFRCDLNQFPYDYTTEVTNDSRDSIWDTECLKSYGFSFITLYRRWWPKPSLRKRNARRQTGCLRRAYK